jgi:hypothetical protein
MLKNSILLHLKILQLKWTFYQAKTFQQINSMRDQLLKHYKIYLFRYK